MLILYPGVPSQILSHSYEVVNNCVTGAESIPRLVVIVTPVRPEKCVSCAVGDS